MKGLSLRNFEYVFKRNQVNPWDQVEELAVDLDGACSLSGLNVDLTSSTFTNSDTLLGLPSLSAFKQELLSPFTNEANGSDLGSSGQKQICFDSGGRNVNSKVESKNNSSVSNGSEENNNVVNKSSNENGCNNSNNVVTTAPATSTVSQGTEDCRFQYVLAAATSIATKVSEETLTYLNQGQPYEIKLKKLGDLSEYRGKILKSVVRLTFHERRLQFMEREQMAIWVASHPGDSILEVDLPLSYGIFDLNHDAINLNSVEFLWDPTKEVGVYIKVNCISTEFTPKKHGGEKGVPFRIQVETYLHGESPSRRLHAASCQVKVFKLKGADRKHKQDREKIQKRPPNEQEKYQCSYECTILTDVALNSDHAFPPLTIPPNPSLQQFRKSEKAKYHQVDVTGNILQVKDETLPLQPDLSSPDSPPQKTNADSSLCAGGIFNASWSPQQTSLWLQANRYSSHLNTLSSYSGTDLLRLSKDNLTQLCGLPDGIRLYNALHSRSAVLTLYVCIDIRDQVYQAVYLSTCTSSELIHKMSAALGLTVPQIAAVYVRGPNNIKIIITDELVTHLPDQSAYLISILQDGPDKYQLLLKMSEQRISSDSMPST
ncbi:transcription factor CP2 like gemini isoform X2 [Rhodnius prolixus]|uniref:transcription factor CP2 like gemini isoform X2 n=1 Tax=Rhodnius prolixus TaxID=13249 RepID=UPI003D18BE58